MNGSSLSHKVIQTVGVLLAVAIGVRVAAALLIPLAPDLIAIVLLVGIAWFLFGHHRS